MKRVRIFLVCLAFLAAGCPSSSSVGYVDRSDLPEYFLGSSHRAWLEGSRILVEVDQLPGLNVARIGYRVDGDAIYLLPQRISSGGAGTSVLSVDLASEAHTNGWETRIYWLTEEYFYPIGHPGFWNASKRKPSERVELQLEP